MSSKDRYILPLNRYDRHLNPGQWQALGRRFRQGGYAAALGLLTCQLAVIGITDAELDDAIVICEALLC